MADEKVPTLGLDERLPEKFLPEHLTPENLADVHLPRSEAEAFFDARPPLVGLTADFTSAASSLNTINKAAGRLAFNSTTNKPLWATGSTPTSTWVNATGAVEHTPA